MSAARALAGADHFVAAHQSPHALVRWHERRRRPPQPTLAPGRAIDDQYFPAGAYRWSRPRRKIKPCRFGLARARPCRAWCPATIRPGRQRLRCAQEADGAPCGWRRVGQISMMAPVARPSRPRPDFGGRALRFSRAQTAPARRLPARRSPPAAGDLDMKKNKSSAMTSAVICVTTTPASAAQAR